MHQQTDHERARIIEAHDTRAQEAYWGDDDEEPEADYYERNRQDEIDDAAEGGAGMSESVEQWALRRSQDSGRCAGIMEAYDALRDRLDETDRKLLLDMARDALMGNR